MNFGKTLKIVQFNILKQAGISVTPQQVGLKEDPFAKYQNTNSPFSALLGNLTGNTSTGNALSIPQAPTPPTDTSDPLAQAEFNQAMVAYNQQLYAHNQSIMQQIIFQIQSLQQQIQANNSANASGISKTFEPSLGVGDIL